MTFSLKGKKFEGSLISLFLSLYVVLSIFGFFEPNTVLDGSSEFVIGEATKHGVSIGDRVSNFYKLIFFGIGLLLVLIYLTRRHLNFTKITYSKELLFVLIVGVTLQVLDRIKGTDQISTIFLHGQLILLLLLELIIRLNTELRRLDEDVVFGILFSGVALSVWTANPYVAFLGELLLLLLAFKANRFVFRLFWLICAASPFILFLGVESTLILNQNGVFISYIFLICVWLVLLVGALFAFKWHKIEVNQFVYAVLAPFIVIGVTTVGVYSPIIEQPEEMFELANKLNPIMLMSQHDQVPLIDFVSSHLFSDFFFESIYSFLNGFDGSVAPLIYTGFNHVLSVLIIYYFLQTVIGKKPEVLLMVLFSPFIFFILPSTFSFLLIPGIFLFKFFQRQQKKYLFFTGISIFLLVFWRLDLGVAAVGSGLATFLLMFTVMRDHRKTLIKVILSLGVPASLMTVFYLGYHRDFFEQLLGYFGGAQAHGLHQLSGSETNLFYLNYYILPGIIALITVYLLLKLRALKFDEFYWLLVFLSGVYLFNLQRGLIRHSFIEVNEYYIASYGWLIITLFAYFVLLRKERSASVLLFSSLAGFFLSIHGIESWKSVFDQDRKLIVTNLPDTKRHINRLIPNPNYLVESYPLVDFINDELNDEQTFLDFSNTPLLYYHTKKMVPSIFCQYLQNTVSEDLQLKNLERLKTEDIPFVVFNQNPESYFDQTDGIPNEVRYFRVVKFIYENYLPLKQIGKYHVWKRRGMEGESFLFPMPDHWQLGYIPYYWSRSLRKKGVKKTATSYSSGEFLLLTLKSDASSTGSVSVGDDLSIGFDILKGVNVYALPLGSSYHYLRSESAIDLVLGESVTVIKKEYTKN